MGARAQPGNYLVADISTEWREGKGGNYFYQQFSSSAGPTGGFKLTGVRQCVQEEGVSQGIDPDSPNGTGSAMASIEADMTTNCRLAP